MPNSIVHFEIPADDTARACDFYRKLFGWKISDPFKMDYFICETKKDGEAGINGGIMQRKMPGQTFTNYINVPSIDAFLPKVTAAGGTVHVPKQEIGQGMGWIALFMDTEGNMIGLHQAPPGMGANAANKSATTKFKKKSAKKKPAKKAAKKKAKKKAKRR